MPRAGSTSTTSLAFAAALALARLRPRRLQHSPTAASADSPSFAVRSAHSKARSHSASIHTFGMLPSWAAADEESNKRRKRLLIGGGIAAFALLVVVGTRKAEDASLSSYLPAGLGISTPYSFSSQDGQEFAEEWGEGVEQTEVPWSEEEERLREYKWETPEIDETLKVMLDGLNEVSSSSRLGAGQADPPSARRKTAGLEIGYSQLVPMLLGAWGLDLEQLLLLRRFAQLHLHEHMADCRSRTKGLGSSSAAVGRSELNLQSVDDTSAHWRLHSSQIRRAARGVADWSPARAHERQVGRRLRQATRPGEPSRPTSLFLAHR